MFCVGADVGTIGMIKKGGGFFVTGGDVGFFVDGVGAI